MPIGDKRVDAISNLPKDLSLRSQLLLDPSPSVSMRTAIAVTLLFVSSISLNAATNVLADSGFDMSTHASQTNPVWDLVANQPDGTQFSAQFQDAPWASNPAGQPGIGVWLKAFEGNQADGEPLANVTVSQTVSAIPGVSYELAVWNRQETNYTAVSTFFSVEFLDAGGSVLSLERSDITTHPKDGSWQQYALTAVAPASTTQATVKFGMVDGVDAKANPQSAMFDDVTFSADVIPEPSSAALGVLGLVGLALRRRR